MSKLDTLDPYVTDTSDWTLADYEAEGLGLVIAGRIAGQPGMKAHHDRAVARAYALIAAPRMVTNGVLSKSGDAA